MASTTNSMVRALGLMSGTSMDGVDLAILDTDGEHAMIAGPTGFSPYGEPARTLLRQAIVDARDLQDRSHRPGVLAQAEAMITDTHAEAVEAFLARYAIDRDTLDVIGFHGQTVLHRPEHRLTVQIGEGAVLARRIGVPVVADFRASDVAAGGQGAPLVPVFHQALVRAAGLPSPTLVINIGGVGNITLVTLEGEPVACDTGPGNALIDDLLLERTGAAFDRDGAAAAAGRSDPTVLEALLAHPYFALPAPKSLDRNAFSKNAVDALALADAAATLTAFTAVSIARVLDHLPHRPALAIVCGGGAHNRALMLALRDALPCPVESASHCGWLPDAIEAQAFAYLAVRSRRDLPLTFPTTTGVGQAQTGGRYFQP